MDMLVWFRNLHPLTTEILEGKKKVFYLQAHFKHRSVFRNANKIMLKEVTGKTSR